MASLKTAIKWVLEKVVSRQRFNDSALYDLYLSLTYPEHAKRRRLERALFGKLISEAGGGLVFDIGANGGAKTAIFARFAKHVVSVEPSAASVTVLRERFALNPRVTIVPKGVGATEGTATLHVLDESDCLNTFSQAWVYAQSDVGKRASKTVLAVVETPMTTLDRLIIDFGVPSYIKIDVEGYELETIRGLSTPIPLISVECNCPEFQQDAIDIVRILRARNPDIRFNYFVTEPPLKFEKDNWIEADEMLAIISGELRFLEIFCRLDGSR